MWCGTLARHWLALGRNLLISGHLQLCAFKWGNISILIGIEIEIRQHGAAGIPLQGAVQDRPVLAQAQCHFRMQDC